MPILQSMQTLFGRLAQLHLQFYDQVDDRIVCDDSVIGPLFRTAVPEPVNQIFPRDPPPLRGSRLRLDKVNKHSTVAWPTLSGAWVAWVNRMRPHFESTWRAIRIDDFIRLTCYDHPFPLSKKIFPPLRPIRPSRRPTLLEQRI